MIIALADAHGGTLKSVLAANLAAMRAMKGRRVALLDGDSRKLVLFWAQVRREAGQYAHIRAAEIAHSLIQPQLEKLVAQHDDVVIDAGDGDSLRSRAALVFAHKLVVLVDLCEFARSAQTKLGERLAIARLYNPRLQVLFVIVSDDAEPPLQVIGAALSFIVTVTSANLANALIHPAQSMFRAFAHGLALAEWSYPDEKAMREIAGIYQEIFCEDWPALQRQQQAVTHRGFRDQIAWLRRVIFKLLP